MIYVPKFVCRACGFWIASVRLMGPAPKSIHDTYLGWVENLCFMCWTHFSFYLGCPVDLGLFPGDPNAFVFEEYPVKGATIQ